MYYFSKIKENNQNLVAISQDQKLLMEMYANVGLVDNKIDISKFKKIEERIFFGYEYNREVFPSPKKEKKTLYGVKFWNKTYLSFYPDKLINFEGVTKKNIKRVKKKIPLKKLVKTKYYFVLWHKI